jgi:hypothetical protein
VSDSQTVPTLLLRESTVRHATVDRLLGRSVWSGLVTFMLVPMAVNVAFLLVWSSTNWLGSGLDSKVLIGAALSTLLWLSLAVIELARRLRALATILERSGVLARYLGVPTSPLMLDPRGTEPPAV